MSDHAGPMICVRDLHKTYRHGGQDVHALRGVDLDVPPGQLLLLTGRSGAGKTTLLSLVAGLRRADQGQITVADHDVTAASERELVELRRRTVGVIYQDFALLPLLTAEENVGLPLRITRAAAQERDATVAALLDRVGLSAHARQRPDELSGGQQQRVAIARALAIRPHVLLADEPTAQLDSETGAQVMALLRTLVVEQGTTAVVATHDPAMQQFADAVVHLEDGRLTDPVRAAVG
ncbi:ABC transporter ATP-binding protein [Nocardioides coralli]|uniref:ABC transporter ATP-binding protein n=1 Tax=Nocardioides coralli TaxID=2872154 RepID=UPI001CA44583|nr:ABC transporter ATP-binding protein [Nocardioides coralli]QZY28876.1 ABC transporter ATP-binding protein [Nocardioides coralli]